MPFLQWSVAIVFRNDTVLETHDILMEEKDMLDLAARVFYKAHFDIVRETENMDLLRDVVIANLSQWLKKKYSISIRYWNWAQFAEYGTFDTENHRTIAKTTSFKEGKSRYWACKIEEFEDSMDDDDSVTTFKKAPRIWTTEVGFEQSTPDRATISYICYYTDKAGFVGIVDSVPTNNTPGFIRNLLYCYGKKFHCEIGKMTLSPVPILLQIGKGDEFAALIKDSERKVPIILIMPSSRGVTDEMQLLSKKLARNTMGNALVYEAADACISEELTYFLDRVYWCLPGQVRIYWPEGNSKIRRNRYLTEDEIEKMGNDTVIGIFRRVLSTDIRYYESKEMFRIEDCDELYRQKRISNLRSQYQVARESIAKEKANGAEIQEQFELANELLILADEEKKDLQNKIAALEMDLDDTKQKLWKVSAHKEQLLSEQEQARGIKQGLINIRNFNKLPTSAYDVAQFFRKVFCDTIDFTDRGMRSLSDCATRPKILWECFFAMATKLVELYRKNTPEIDKVFHAETGWDMARGEGSSTRKNRENMALRNDKYQERDIKTEQHVRKGNVDDSPDCVRVYFCYDKVSDRIVISHVGNHLDNHTTLSV